MIAFGFWDGALLVLVSLQGALLSYLEHPKWKALIMVLPIPFTLATLAVGAPIQATHVAALNVLLGYTHGVRLLHEKARWPILPAIAVSAAGYCVVGALLRPRLPQTDGAFWAAGVLTLAVAAAAYLLYPRVTEPGHRSLLSPWIKLPLIALVILALIVLKKTLGGFMALFPMVGVIASYEARKSLGAICRAMPVFVFAMVPMMAAVRLAQPRLGLFAALLIGWLAFLPFLAVLLRDYRAPAPVPAPSAD